ncbi:MAG: VCBS repeat-containing protein [Planctomycetes bacterium]|nr:VCBS repeat-containing protein [Planctomycetota bacterium]
MHATFRTPFLLFLSGALVSIASAQELSFQPRADFDFAAELPRQMAQADFDHDGHLDLVATNLGQGGGRIDVHFGDGSSDFGSNYELPLPSAEALGLGDFDHDGWMDIAAGITVWAHQDVHLFRNDHAGGFTPSTVLYPLAYGPKGLAAADFDGDGHLDLAIASTSSSNVLTWFPGNGDMTFDAGRVVPSTSQDSATRLIAADFNADGKPDMAMSRTTGARVFINPLPGFQFQNSFDLPTNAPIVSLAAADVDGDGVLDLVTASGTGFLDVWQGAGDGTFGLLQEYPVPGAPSDLRAGDVNSDGVVDVLISSSSGLQLYLGLGGGAFGAQQTVASGVQPTACELGDWNGDGRLDLATACSNGGGQAYLSVHEQRAPTAEAYCFGDGSVPTACPCGNTGATGNGCASSFNAAGAHLTATGSTAQDDVVLVGSGMQATGTCLFLQGDLVDPVGVVFGDGVSCTGGALLRLRSVTLASGWASFPAPPETVTLSARGGVVVGSGAVRSYTVYYRNAAAAFCPPATFNAANAYRITW